MPPRFYSTRNLLAYGLGFPDGNRRFVHHWPSRSRKDDEIATFNASDPEAGWTEKDDRALRAYLAVLNEEKADGHS